MARRSLLLSHSHTISATVNSLIDHRLTPESKKKYDRQWTKFSSFASSRKSHISESNFDSLLADYCSVLAKLGLARGTINTYSSTILSSAKLKLRINVTRTPLTKATLAGIARLQADTALEPKRLAITSELATHASLTSEIHSICLFALTIGVGIFARSSELFPEKSHLSPSHFSEFTFSSNNDKLWSARAFKVSLPSSKSDRFGVPSAVRHLVDPYAVQLLTLRLRMFPDTSSPIFSTSSGPLTRDLFNKTVWSWIRTSFPHLPSPRFSMRSGALNNCLRAGISEQDIMLGGSWKSDAVRAYIRTNSASLSRNLLPAFTP